MFFEVLVIVFNSFDRFGLQRKHLMHWLDIAALIITVCCFLSPCPIVPNDLQLICMLLKVLQIWVCKSDHAVVHKDKLSMRNIISGLITFRLKRCILSLDRSKDALITFFIPVPILLPAIFVNIGISEITNNTTYQISSLYNINQRWNDGTFYFALFMCLQFT